MLRQFWATLVLGAETISTAAGQPASPINELRPEKRETAIGARTHLGVQTGALVLMHAYQAHLAESLRLGLTVRRDLNIDV